MSAEVVEWHTWSGRRHKFGPPRERRTWMRDDLEVRTSLCSGGISADNLTQKVRPEKAICKRCFPDASHRSPEERLAAAAATLHEFVNVRGDFYEPQQLAWMVEKLADAIGCELRPDWLYYLGRQS